MKKFPKLFLGIIALTFIFLSSACTNPMKSPSDIYSQIKQYEWTDLYKHKNSYEDSCACIFTFMPSRLRSDFTDSLEVKIDKDNWDIFGAMLAECLIPHYGGIYEKGIPMKNRYSYEESYSVTLEFLRTIHKEYIELGIIKKKKEYM